MRRPRIKFSPWISASVIILSSCLLLAGCSGSHAEYDPKSPWIGARATFGPPMAYITNLPVGYSDKEEIRIGRVLTTLRRAEDDKQYIRIMRDVIITPVPAGTAFEVIAVFTRVQDGISRLFSDDYDIIVLRDSHGNLSTTLVSEFQNYAQTNAGDKS